MTDSPRNLLDLTLPELEHFCSDMGEPPFRARQLWQWLWQKRACDFSAMSNISRELRKRLAETAVIIRPETVETQVSQDGTTKFLLALEDERRIESVLIPEKDHFTLCLSSQVGCSLGCTFCATGQMGLARNLSLAEILGQDEALVTPETGLWRSVDAVSVAKLVIACERRFKITIDDERLPGFGRLGDLMEYVRRKMAEGRDDYVLPDDRSREAWYYE